MPERKEIESGLEKKLDLSNIKDTRNPPEISYASSNGAKEQEKKPYWKNPVFYLEAAAVALSLGIAAYTLLYWFANVEAYRILARKLDLRIM